MITRLNYQKHNSFIDFSVVLLSLELFIQCKKLNLADVKKIFVKTKLQKNAINCLQISKIITST